MRDEFEHLHFSDLTIDLKIGDYKLRLDNIVKGDETLSNKINIIFVFRLNFNSSFFFFR